MANNYIPNFQAQETIRAAIRAIALKGVINPATGSVRGTEKVAGYVAKIHMDEDDELYGTIDVQEFTTLEESDTYDPDMGIGYHEGVYISSIQDSKTGFVIIPLLYSEVVIDKDADTGQEYVTMFSHVQHVQIDSHETISIGVDEREPFDVDDDNSPDIHRLERKGNHTKTEYNKDAVSTEVLATDSNNQTNLSKQVLEATCFNLTVDNEGAEVDIKGDYIDAKVGDSKVKVTDGVVYVGSENQNDVAVLGTALADILDEILGALTSAQVTTQLGPQPFINMGQFVSVKSKIAAFKQATSGFLTNKVKIHK